MQFLQLMRKYKRPLRITLGSALILTGLLTSNAWFFLGIIPLLVGITNYCPVCALTGKCSI